MLLCDFLHHLIRKENDPFLYGLDGVKNRVNHWAGFLLETTDAVYCCWDGSYQGQFIEASIYSK
jgi:hypothetical protein